MESVHAGHAVVMNATGEVVQSWGNPDHVTYPRSSAKILQALPLVESGVAERMGLTQAQLALSCASHSGAAIHTAPVQRWLGDMDMDDDAFVCGPQWPADLPARNDLVKTDSSPCRRHNNCSGKHCGFLTMVKANGWGPEYADIDHPLQEVIKQTFEEVTDETSGGWGIDGCSAPNHAVSKDRACTHLMRAGKGKVSVKTGAEGYFIAIIPDQKLGVALKIMDGTTRAAECAMAAILCRLGVVDAADPLVSRYANPTLKNFAGLVTGDMRAVL